MAVSFTKVKLPNGWLGNMSSFPVVYESLTWKTNEALFQALRFYKDSPIREEIRSQASPMGAKMVAKKNAASMNIDQKGPQDLDNMRLCLRLKIEQHPELKKALLETGNELIVEDIGSRINKPGNHTFWGAALVDGKWVGENTLGKLWMELRSQL